MSWIEAIVLGIVQGLTEFLPISSTGHIRIVPELFGWEDPGTAFSAVIQLGTIAAVLIYFWRDLYVIARTWAHGLVNADVRRRPESLMGWYIILGTVPLVVFGLLFSDIVETGLRSLWITVATLIIGGVIMLLVERYAPRKRPLGAVNKRDAIVIGLTQALALIPGVSRAGATIVGGLAMGLEREAAARFSFLLSVPAVILSGVYQFKDVGGADGVAIGPTVVATVISFVAGYASIALLLRYLARHSLAVFAWYRFALGGAMIVLILTGLVTA